MEQKHHVVCRCHVGALKLHWLLWLDQIRKLERCVGCRLDQNTRKLREGAATDGVMREMQNRVLAVREMPRLGSGHRRSGSALPGVLAG